MNVWLTDGERGACALYDAHGRVLSQKCPCPYCPCATHQLLICACRMQRDVVCYAKQTMKEISRLPALPGLCDMCPSPCGRYLYQLSGEADALHARALATGELLYGCRFGVFPRDLRLHASGRYLLAAGGATGEIALLTAPELRVRASARFPGTVCAADFWRDGLVIVCAIGDGDIRTVLYTTGALNAEPTELMRFDGQPGGLRVSSDGVTAILGALDGACGISLSTGQVLWNLPRFPLCGHVRCKSGWALLSDGIGGETGLVPLGQPSLARVFARGGDLQASFV